MAKATATCTCKTCGREFEKIVYGGNRRDADSKADWAATHFDECEDCYAARKARERDDANAAAEKAAKEAGLPELTGTEKQVAWANTIWAGAFRRVEEAIKKAENGVSKNQASGKDTAFYDRRVARYSAFRRFLLSHTTAHWWIDNRRKSTDAIAVTFNNFRGEFEKWMEAHGDEPLAPDDAEKVSEELRKEAEAEMVAAPQEQTHAGTVEVTVTDTEVSAKYEKDDDFRAIVKRLGYCWNADRRVWEKAISYTTGTAQERATELGSNLLNAGFAVQIADPETRAAAVNGDYQPEHRRWITAYFGGDYKGWLCVRLPERGDGMYEKARAIKGSRYCKPNVAVPAKQWREALDFAELNDYRISPAAQKIIDAQRAAVIVVAPAPAKAAEYHETDPAELMGGGSDVLDDLRDD